MSQTSLFALPLLQTSQAQKEITHNEAMALLDMLVAGKVESAALTAPPTDPEPGQAWIVGEAATGAWTDHDRDLALFDVGGWRFVPPTEGFAIWISDQELPARFDGEAWSIGAVHASHIIVGTTAMLGGQQSAIADPSGGAVVDTEARAALAAILSTLRSHGLIATN